MGSITTSSFTEPLRYPNQQWLDRENYDGDLWFVKRVSQTQFDIFKSSDNGSTWAAAGVTYTRANLQEISNCFMDSNGHMHVIMRTYESGQDRLYYMRRAADQQWGGEVLITSVSAASAGAVYTGLSLVAFKLSNTWYVHTAVGTQNGTNGGITLFSLTVDSTGSYVTVRNTLVTGTRQWLNGPAGIVHPTIDFAHTGDGKTPSSSPALWLVWGRSTVYTAKLAWATGPSWAGTTNTPPVVSGLSPSQPSNSATWDAHGSRWLVPFPVGNVVRTAERNVDNSAQITRDTPTHPNGVVKHCAISVSSATSNMRIFAVGTTNSTLYFVDYDRTGDSWSAWTQVSAAAIVGTNAENYTVRRTNHGNGHYDAVIATGSTPFNLISTSNTAASAPKTPTITSPGNGTPQDVNVALPLTWTFVDDDPSDFQNSYSLRRTIGAVTTYWNASTSTWDAIEVFNSSGTTGVTLPAGWGADDDATHFYSVKVKDQQGNSSPNGFNIRVTPSAKDNPTITSPTASPTSALITVAWTVATQTAYRIVMQVTSTGTVIRDTGWVTSTATSVVLPDSFLAQSYTLSLTTRNDESLTSNTVTQVFTPSYTPPQSAASILTPIAASGIIRSSIINPDPTGGEAVNQSNTLYRRKVGDTGAGVKVATISPSVPVSLVAPYNPGFESTISSVNWGTANGAISTAARDTTQFHGGIASYAQTAVSGAGFAGINYGPSLATFPFVTGEQATLSFWFKANAGVQVRGSVGWRTAANVSSGTSSGTLVTATGAWQLFTMTATAPANTAFGFPSLGSSPTANVAGDKIYVDDVYFAKATASALAVVYDDFTVASGVNYEYSVVTTAVNGSVTQSGWVS